ncbi:DNA polymerase subunit Cdc27 [Phaeosphaeriaceae sp. PMI808]|nr:DNA polymerase subunit Cdc27 [Phaeosphaeriaceae sp. PMI808]
MAEEQYKDYLAARVLTESKPVTYRLLSRVLQVDVNSAKSMLFDFHQKQNARKAKSVHATYLVTGKKSSIERTNGAHDKDSGDIPMRSSPFMSSMPEPEESVAEPVKRTTIVLVREEELEKTRAEFDGEPSIHIYSLEPSAIENLGILAACNQEAATESTDEDPMNRWKIYGSIQNPYVKRRTAKFTPPTTLTSKPTVKPVPKPDPVFKTKAKDVTIPTRGGTTSEGNASNRSTPQSSAGSGTLKRSDSKSGARKSQTAGDLFKSFAKAKPKAKDANASKESTPVPLEDETMQGMSEDEGDADDEPEVMVDTEKNEAARKAREERQEKLRKMMEDDGKSKSNAFDLNAELDSDEEMLDAPAETASQPAVTSPDNLNSQEPDDTEPTVTVQNGRRRGRRRVMKKKKVKDEDGYLVTKEEAVWESFSEAEPEPKKLKPAPGKPSSSAKGKPAGKKGQGSIASFFKKA